MSLSRSRLVLSSRLCAVLAMGISTACSNPDPHIPKQVAPPTVAQVKPGVLDDAQTMAAADVAATVPAPDAAAPAPDAAPTEVAAAETTPTAPAIDPTKLGDGDEAARKMLDEPEWDNAPRFATWCAESIARAGLARTRLQGDEPSEADTLKDLNALSRELDTAGALAGLMFEVNPSKAVRDAAETCTQDIQKFATDVGLDTKVYASATKVKLDALEPVAQYFLTKQLRDFKRAGVDKDDATRARIAEINAALVKLGQDYSKTMNGDVHKIELTDVKDLDGLPQDWIDAHPKNAEGKIVITTDYPDFFPFETYAKSGELRKKLYQEFSSRGYPANGETLKKVLLLRKELATLLGYPNYAAYITEDKMSGSQEVVAKFIADIQAIIRPRADKDLKQLIARKQKDDPKATTFEVQDRFYYMNLLRKDKANFDAQSVRPYFSYPKVKEGIFTVYGKLFGVAFTRLENVKAWAPDVEAWEMKRGDEVVGRFFLDMHPRADKFKHAAMFPIQTGLAEGRLPWASLVCNFPDPAKDPSALMEHSDVTTFFHEFGHLIHHLLARSGQYVAVSGINVEWDFVEAPSQLLEEWAWDPKVLAVFAKEIKTGEVLPAKIVEKMRKASELGKGVDLQRQVYLTAYSFNIHTVDPTTLDLDAFTNEMYTQYSPFPKFEGDRLYANFGHLIDYSAIYYTYQWSLAIAKDLFTRFAAKGLMSEAVAAEYRMKVLEPGGTKKAGQLVEDFLGRPRNLDAYKAWIERD